MVSKFGWIDFSEKERRQMLDVVHLFSERETRDELGIGTIRDSFSEHFFPWNQYHSNARQVHVTDSLDVYGTGKKESAFSKDCSQGKAI